METLRQQRIGIQQRYASFKLRSGFYSPATRAAWIQQASDFLTVIVLTAAIVAGVSYSAAGIYHSLGASMVAIVATAIGGLSSMVVVAFRVLSEGLQLDAESERYSWYLAAVDAIGRRFDQGDLAEKVEELRNLEETSYREMRSFFLSTSRARFLM